MGKNRNEVPENLKWRLEDIFETVDEWNKVYEEVSGKLDFSKYEGKLGDGDMLLECLESLNAVIKDVSRLAVYAFMRRDEDTRDSASAALMSRMDMMEMQLMSNIAFINPELTELPIEVLEGFAAEERFKD